MTSIPLLYLSSSTHATLYAFDLSELGTASTVRESISKSCHRRCGALGGVTGGMIQRGSQGWSVVLWNASRDGDGPMLQGPLTGTALGDHVMALVDPRQFLWHLADLPSPLGSTVTGDLSTGTLRLGPLAFDLVDPTTRPRRSARRRSTRFRLILLPTQALRIRCDPAVCISGLAVSLSDPTGAPSLATLQLASLSLTHTSVPVAHHPIRSYFALALRSPPPFGLVEVIVTTSTPVALSNWCLSASPMACLSSSMMAVPCSLPSSSNCSLPPSPLLSFV